MKTPFSDKAYDMLKWVAIFTIPAIETFILTVGVSFGWEYTSQAATLCNSLGVLLAALIGYSKVAYDRERKEKYEGEE